MELLLGALCDAAEVYEGKLCILGAFDTISAHQFPVHHSQCAVALRILCRVGDEGSHELRVRLIDPDGRSVLPGGGPDVRFDLHHIPENTHFLSQNFVFHFQGLPLPKPAAYSIDITMDAEIIARLPLQVVQLPPKK